MSSRATSRRSRRPWGRARCASRASVVEGVAPPRQIVLVGLSGAGKSSVGAILAERLGWPLLDTDDLVTEREGKTPARLIVEQGEARLREVEARVVVEAAA